MISHKYRCIYIHIPKTAGSSIEKKLGHFDKFSRGVQDHRGIMGVQPLVFPGLKYGLFDYRLKYWLKRNIKQKVGLAEHLSQEVFNSYFKFTFVRNPWARVFSWYKNVMRDEHHQKKLGIKQQLGLCEFLDNYSEQWALKPQLYWIKDIDGKIPLDFIGRFENLQKDFEYVAEKLGLEDAGLPHLLAGNTPPYVDYYDEHSRKLVAKKYSEEIKLFGYEFGRKS